MIGDSFLLLLSLRPTLTSPISYDVRGRLPKRVNLAFGRASTSFGLEWVHHFLKTAWGDHHQLHRREDCLSEESTLQVQVSLGWNRLDSITPLARNRYLDTPHVPQEVQILA